MRYAQWFSGQGEYDRDREITHCLPAFFRPRIQRNEVSFCVLLMAPRTNNQEKEGVNAPTDRQATGRPAAPTFIPVGGGARPEQVHCKASASVLMLRLPYPTETALSNKITENIIVLSFKDSPRIPLGRRPIVRSWSPLTSCRLSPASQHLRISRRQPLS